MRCALYARFSSDLQSDQSVEDQIRILQERADREGWEVVNCYTDHAISGASLNRPGVQSLIRDIKGGAFDIILSEALDRLSRDLGDTSYIQKLCRFQSVEIVTLAEGTIGVMDAALKGLMNQLFLDDMKKKVLRGQRGRVETGKVTAGLAFGYEVVKKFDANGEPVRGERAIVPEKAAVVHRIYQNYADGIAPKAIAKKLNEEGILSPTGKHWHPSTIIGHRSRGHGILNCDLYRGLIVWNKTREDKEPGTNRRVPRANPESEWVIHEAEHLRIVDDELWAAVKARQGDLNKRKKFQSHKRPKYLLSGLLKCGKCGSGYSIEGHGKYACSNLQNNGTCDNNLRIKRTDLEEAILNGLRTYLMDDALLGEFCAEFTAHSNQIRMEQNSRVDGYKQELARIAKSNRRCIEAIKDGIPALTVKDEMIELNDRRQELEKLLEDTDETPPLLHPAMGEYYRKAVNELIAVLESKDHSTAAQTAIRTLIEKVVLMPNEDESGLLVNLHGDLAGILAMAERKENGPMKQQKLVKKGSALLQPVTLRAHHLAPRVLKNP